MKKRSGLGEGMRLDGGNIGRWWEGGGMCGRNQGGGGVGQRRWPQVAVTLGGGDAVIGDEGVEEASIRRETKGGGGASWESSLCMQGYTRNKIFLPPDCK